MIQTTLAHLRRPAPNVVRSTLILAASLGILLAAPIASAKAPPPLRGPIATIGDRTVEAIDIEIAARALAGDPSSPATPRAWRRFLLDRCVDRELLSAEAARRGWLDSAAVKRSVASAEYTTLAREVYTKVLIPGVVPTPDEFAEIKAEAHYRYVDLGYIYVGDDATNARRPLADRIAARARAGGAWDSLAKMYSGHPPSASVGGKLGFVLVQDLEPVMWPSFRGAKVGDVLGPFTGPRGHDILKIEGWRDVSDDSLLKLVTDRRGRLIHDNHRLYLLRRYHFAVDTLAAYDAMAAFGSEVPDSILASLGPDGTRPAAGVRRALGVIARFDGGTVTMADIIRDAKPMRNPRGLVRVRDQAQMAQLAGQAAFRRLVVLDARDRGLHQEPSVARELRMQRDGAATRAMVAHARPADPSPSALTAYIESRASRYRWPAGRRATVLVFADEDSARSALKAWNGVGLPPDATIAAMGFREMPRPAPDRLLPGRRAELVLRDDGHDPISPSVRGLAPGQFAPVIRTPHGWAVAYVTAPEEARAMTEDEAAPLARRHWREEKEDQWVNELLIRLRAKTPVEANAARLEAVRLASPGPKRKG
ncbi:MAG TPA: peptidyl-prolyl cis-trans isomerase [Acidobacteriota bacterium]|nr:peptidyl-prolyl cis-trans isomerase [Acidobacteriota bacterium]